MVSQFISPDKVGLLGDLSFDFPQGIHAVGRLDNESEGLLLLTTNRKVTRLLFSGTEKHERSYLVMVQNEVATETLRIMREGIEIPVQAGLSYKAIPRNIKIVSNPRELYPYSADLREKYPHTWLLITLTEGKFRQVRKMVMAARHRCLRLIRISIGNIVIGSLAPGEVQELEEKTFFSLLGISHS